MNFHFPSSVLSRLRGSAAPRLRGVRRGPVLAAALTASLAAPSILAAPAAQQAVPAEHKIFEPVYAVSPASMPTGSVVLDEVEWVDDQQQARHELYIYLGASRVGIEVLHLDLSQLELEPPESPLVHLGIVQVPGEAEGLYIRLDPDTGERQLIVCNTWGGIRVLKYRF